MANIASKHNLTIKGIVSIEEEKILVEVDGIDTPINVADYIEDFDGKPATITIAHSEEFA